MPNRNSTKPNTKSRSGLNSGLDILECLAAQGRPLTLSEIATFIAMAKSSVSSLLATLQQRGLVRRLADQRYVIGIRAWEIGCRAGPVEFGRLALPQMVLLAREISDGVALAMLEHDHTICIQLVESPSAIRVHANIGDSTPAHCASSGLAMLATLRDEEVEQILPEQLEQITPMTIGSRDDLLLELGRVRERGYAVYRGGWRVDVGGVAIALRGSDQRAVAVLNVALPINRMTPEWIDQAMPPIRRAAHAIEREFGAHAAEASTVLPGATPRAKTHSHHATTTGDING